MTHHHLLKLDKMPDVLILPSQLTKFAKVRWRFFEDSPDASSLNVTDPSSYRPPPAMILQVVDSVVVVNPGRLSQFSSGGTFAKLSIHPLDQARLVSSASKGGETLVEHEAFDRCRVDIVRI